MQQFISLKAMDRPVPAAPAAPPCITTQVIQPHAGVQLQAPVAMPSMQPAPEVRALPNSNPAPGPVSYLAPVPSGKLVEAKKKRSRRNVTKARSVCACCFGAAAKSPPATDSEDAALVGTGPAGAVEQPAALPLAPPLAPAAVAAPAAPAGSAAALPKANEPTQITSLKAVDQSPPTAPVPMPVAGAEEVLPQAQSYASIHSLFRPAVVPGVAPAAPVMIRGQGLPRRPQQVRPAPRRPSPTRVVGGTGRPMRPIADLPFEIVTDI